MEPDQALEAACPLAQRFRTLFKAQLGHLPHTESFTDRYEVAVPAPNADLGELRVRDDGDELTISVGPHHWHVSLYQFEEEAEERRADLVAETAVDDVRRVVDGRTVIRVQRRADGSVGTTSSLDVEYANKRPAAADEVEYLWSGPR
jgi:hypothetical protein